MRVLRIPLLIALPVLLVAACKQGQGERCQVDRDCSSGLVCSSQMICVPEGQQIIDAAPMVDGPIVIDARVPDATPPMPDAAPVSDAH
jgi:hypothetical protein